MKVRLRWFFAPLLLLLAATSWAQQEDCTPSGVKLIYPPLARAARVAGTVVASLHIKEDGSTRILSISGHQLFLTSARQSIAVVHYAASCGGRDVEIKFQYTLASSRNSEENTVQTGPGEFTIAARAVIIDHNPH